MTALEIKAAKNIMHSLLISEQFDSFLVEEAVITTFGTFHIDGRTVKEFYSQAELEESGVFDFALWKDIRPFCFQLIKGKKTPISFKLVLLAPPDIVEKIAAVPECETAANLIRSLVLNIRYEGGRVTCVTGSSFSTFVMDKSVDKLWDAYVRRLLADFGLDFDELC